MSGAGGAGAHDERALRKEAVAWYALMCSGSASEDDRRAWQQWHQRHPDHQRAWQRIEALRAMMQHVPARIALPVLQPVAKGRRQALRGLALLVSTGALGYVGYRGLDEGGNSPWQAVLADYRTGVGRQRSVELADGSLLVLNTDSAVDVRFSAGERKLVLRAGEILVETAHQRHAHAGGDSRPFLVETEQGSVQALGTRFTLRRRGDATEVVVLEDAVAIRAAHAPQQTFTLRAGQRLSFSAAAIGPAQAADDMAAAWRDGSIVVGDWALGRLVAELGRYRPGRLACDPAVAHLRVSGAFPVGDTDKALAAIATSLPVRIQRLTRYWVTLGAA